MFMHIGGTAQEEVLATEVGKVFSKTKETSGGKTDPPVADIDFGLSGALGVAVASAVGTFILVTLAAAAYVRFSSSIPTARALTM